MNVTQILRGQETTLTLELASDIGTITVGIVDANGDEVVAAGTAVIDGGDGSYSYTLAAQPNLGFLTVTWTEASGNPIFTTFVEVVGNLLFTEAEARGKTVTGQQTPLADDSKFSDADIARVRQLITDQFEQRTGRPWTRRYCRMEVQGSGKYRQPLFDGIPRDSQGNTVGGSGRLRYIARIISATVGGEAVDVANVKVDGSTLIRTDGVWSCPVITDPFNVVVEYEYGPEPVPYEANENGLATAVKTLVPSDVSSYAQSFSGEDGTVRYPSGGLVYTSRTFEWLKQHKPILVA